jgi:hypothetical protein
MAIEVRNNVTGDDRHIARGNNDSPQAIAGTDILTVRGCISGTAYQVDPSTFNWDADDNGRRRRRRHAHRSRTPASPASCSRSGRSSRRF